MSDQPLIYIAGPLRAPDEYSRRMLKQEAERAMLRLLRYGYAVHCPHTHTYGLGGAVPERLFMRAEETIMLRCDAVLVLPGWFNSEGTMAEIDIAAEHDIPAFSSIDALHKWADAQERSTE